MSKKKKFKFKFFSKSEKIAPNAYSHLWDDDFDIGPYVCYHANKCEEKHLAGLQLGNSTLFGLPGKLHETNLKDLNIWLTSVYLPSVLWSSGLSLPAKERHIYFPIVDRSVPKNLDALKTLLETAKQHLDSGLTVGVSCMGGHGRTGLILALLYGLYHPECKDPIQAIRAIGCDKWVESESQAKLISVYLNIPYNNLYNDKVYKPIGPKEQSNAKSEVQVWRANPNVPACQSNHPNQTPRAASVWVGGR